MAATDRETWQLGVETWTFQSKCTNKAVIAINQILFLLYIFDVLNKWNWCIWTADWNGFFLFVSVNDPCG